MSKRPIRTHTHVGSDDTPAVDGGITLPFVVESETEIHHDEVAGPYGKRVSIIGRTCPRCGYDRAKVSHAVLPDVFIINCNACGHEIDSG